MGKETGTPEDWRYFGQGDWTREVPTKPGIYPLAARKVNGPQIGTEVLHVMELDGEPFYSKLGHSGRTPGWSGWFWDRPQPFFPPTPDHYQEESNDV